MMAVTMGYAHMAFFFLEGEGADITTFHASRFGPSRMISTLLFLLLLHAYLYTSLRRAWSETRMSEFSDLGEMITELQGRMLWKEQQPPSDES